MKILTINIKLFIIAFLVLFMIGHASAAEKLSDVIQRNWDAWSKGAPTVEMHDLVSLLADHRLGDTDAAGLVVAVLALHRMEKSEKWEASRKISLKNLLEIADLPKYQKVFEGRLKSIHVMNYELYSHDSLQFERLRQGEDGDCYFFSGIGWIAKYRPDAIRNAIKDIGGERFRVSFADGQSFELDPPTTAEMLFFNSRQSNHVGIWLPLFEKAFGMASVMYRPKKNDPTEPMWNIYNGGDIEVTLRIFTGRKPQVYWLNPLDSRRHPRASLETVKAELHGLRGANKMALASVSRTPPIKVSGKPGFVTNHVYAIMDFDESSNMLTVWNPWGDDFTAKYSDSPQNGYSRRHGIFSIPLDEFIAIFHKLVVESPS